MNSENFNIHCTKFVEMCLPYDMAYCPKIAGKLVFLPHFYYSSLKMRVFMMFLFFYLFGTNSLQFNDFIASYMYQG